MYYCIYCLILVQVFLKFFDGHFISVFLLFLSFLYVFIPDKFIPFSFLTNCFPKRRLLPQFLIKRSSVVIATRVCSYIEIAFFIKILNS